MDIWISNINLDRDLISVFVHKPYNFKRDTVSIEERKKQINKIENEIDYKFGRIIRAKQTHSNNIRVINENNIDEEFEEIDGLITNMKDVALVTSVADCQWILLYDTKNKVIGNIHSGRRWTLSRIITKAIDMFIKEFNSDPKDIKVYISPSIHQCCFEVWEQVKTLFENEFTDIQMDDMVRIWEFKDDEQKYYIDTVELNKRVLLNLWIKKENIIISNECSVCNSDTIHSYRKDKPNDWRNILLISLTKAFSKE